LHNKSDNIYYLMRGPLRISNAGQSADKHTQCAY